jgi:inward rectifier potassium channel
VANARGNEVVEASISVAVLLPETTSEGHTMRRLHDLKLRRAQTPLFAMTWLVMHDLTEGSPLHDLTREQMAEQRARFIVSFTGLDATFSQQVHSRKIYLAEDLRWGERFVDVLNSQSDGTIRFDLTKFHDTEPMPTEERERAAQ